MSDEQEASLQPDPNDKKYDLICLMMDKHHVSFDRAFFAARLCGWDHMRAREHLDDPEEPGVISRLLDRIEALERQVVRR